MTDTTKSIARIYRAAERLPEPARSAVLAELWALRQLSAKAQLTALPRWRACMATWPAA